MRYWLLGIVFLIALTGKSQNSWLEKKVTLNYENVTLKTVFLNIQKQTGIIFSYANLDDQQKVSYHCQAQPLSLVLPKLLNQVNATYKQADKYFIIQLAKPLPEPKLPENEKTIRGFVFNADSNEPLPEVSVYNKLNKASSITNEKGRFQLANTEKMGKVYISISKEGFRDTSLLVENPEERVFTIFLIPLPISNSVNSQLVQDSTTANQIRVEPKDSAINYFKQVREWATRIKNYNLNYKNIKDTLYSEYAISFVPFVTSNKKLGLNTINKYNLNVLGGYSKGTDAIEIGGLLNIDQVNVKYLQIAGLANLVGGKTFGTQIGGLLNVNGNQVKGVQVSGLVNLVGGSVDGVQVAGLSNIVFEETKYVQVAGLFNSTKTMFGSQVSGLVNYAKYVSGVQVSFANFCDSIDGIPLGFFSYVKKGYHHAELSIDEKKLLTLSYRTGVNQFHNIFLISYELGNPQPIWAYGYGLGSIFETGNKWQISLDATAQQLMAINNSDGSLNLLSKVFIGMQYKLYPKFHVVAGPTANFSLFDTSSPNYKTHFNAFSSNYMVSESIEQFTFRFWIGVKFSIRFL
jgi:hypothetical protein